jgi:CheY-like chemotaxis protein
MSYPREIRALVIEDEPPMKAEYEDLFGRLARTFSVAPPDYAFCYNDAQRHLASETIYHLVLLDLRLPRRPGEAPGDALTGGLDLLEMCLKRDDYPIPSLLVISGYLRSVDHQTQLEARVRGGFAYGRIIVKGGDLERELEDAASKVLRYCDVGIHLRCSKARSFPTLGPRDEDLLRRSVLENEAAVGLDLQWWAAEWNKALSATSAPYWTKLLFGRYLLGDARGSSRFRFFKLDTSTGSDIVHREAKLLGNYLRHIRVVGSHIAGDRSLLVTDNASENDLPPVSLEEYLGRPADAVQLFIPSIAEQVASQLKLLGQGSTDLKSVRSLLWEHHDREWIRSQWEKRRGGETEAEANPVRTFEELSACDYALRFTRQRVLHGDLNFTNIALEAADSGVRAYIIDASGTTASVNIRDLAMLEVTAILHQVEVGGPSLLEHCRRLYVDSVVPPGDLDFGEGTNRQRNTLRLIAEIREQAASAVEDVRLYALMVFDIAMLQLGGLELGSSGNKICFPPDAATLASLAARWLRRVAPEFFATGATGPVTPESR